MTALDHTTHAIDAQTRAVAAVTRVANGLGALFRIFVNRREMNRLADLSDRELADIGLMRTDLLVAARAPLGGDPTVERRELVNERITAEDGARRVC